MAKISSYPLDSQISLSDMLIGSDADNNNATKNFSVGDLFGYYNNIHRSYGYFYDDQGQSSVNNNIATAFLFRNVELSNNIGISGDTQIKFYVNGVYNIQFSAQVFNDSGDSERIQIWIAKNGVPITNTSTQNQMISGAYQSVACNFMIESFSSTDYYEIIWSVTSTDLYLDGGGATGIAPATPTTTLIISQAL